MTISKTLTIFFLTVLCSINAYSLNNDTTNYCDKVLIITEQDYKFKLAKPTTLKLVDTFKKTKRSLTILTNKRAIKFENEYEGNEAITSYKVFGQIKIKKWVFVEELGLNSVTYYLINTQTSKIDTLVGEPKIFGNEIVCIEGSYTDSPRFLEVYSISNNTIKIKFKMSLTHCKDLVTAEEPFLYDSKIYLTNLKNKAWTIAYK